MHPSSIARLSTNTASRRPRRDKTHQTNAIAAIAPFPRRALQATPLPHVPRAARQTSKERSARQRSAADRSAAPGIRKRSLGCSSNARGSATQPWNAETQPWKLWQHLWKCTHSADTQKHNPRSSGNAQQFQKDTLECAHRAPNLNVARVC